MQKWEYLVASSIQNDTGDAWVFEAGERKFRSLVEMLGKLGVEGWELVSTSTFVSSRIRLITDSEYFYFKRPTT